MQHHLRKLRKLGLGLVTVLAATTLVFAFRGDSSATFDDARARLDSDCARWRARGGTAWVCDPDARASSFFPVLERGKASAASASRALARGDEAAAERDLGGALDVARDLDRRGTEVGAVMAAAIVRQVLGVIEREVPQTPSGRALVARVLTGRRIESAAHPLRGHLLAASRAVLDLLDRPFARALAVKVLNEEEAVTREMERAIALGDAGRCMRAEQGRSFLTKRLAGSGGPAVCSHLVEVAETAKHLDRARSAALRHAGVPIAVR